MAASRASAGYGSGGRVNGIGVLLMVKQSWARDSLLSAERDGESAFNGSTRGDTHVALHSAVAGPGCRADPRPGIERRGEAGRFHIALRRQDFFRLALQQQDGPSGEAAG